VATFETNQNSGRSDRNNTQCPKISKNDVISGLIAGIRIHAAQFDKLI
jgi:hypothetical protein